MNWLPWWLFLISASLCIHREFALHQARTEARRLRDEASHLKNLADSALAVSAYIVASQGGRVEVPGWVHRSQWEFSSETNPATGVVTFRTRELIQ